MAKIQGLGKDALSEAPVIVSRGPIGVGLRFCLYLLASQLFVGE